MGFLLGVLAADAEGLKGKVMCGYQGWFRVPADGTGMAWKHYGENGVFEPGSCTIDLWPEVGELPEEDRFATDFRHSDGSVAEVFSSVRSATTELHFRWMREYGIDGVFLQRFATSTRNKNVRASLDLVLSNCQKAANEHERSWVLMYDLSGLKKGQLDTVREDWIRLQSSHQVASEESDTCYLRHKGKPLVALWGLGFSDRPELLEEWAELLRFFREDAVSGGCSVMVGVPSYWRTLQRDSIGNRRLHELLETVDVISSWSVGRFYDLQGAERFANEVTKPDLAWCRERGIDYLPVAFPGFSWQNLKKHRGKEANSNQIPRLGGDFLWAQAWHAKQAGAKSIYLAMFDELDEGTALFKCDPNPPVGASQFVWEEGVPSDEYLWLSGRIGELFGNDGKEFSSKKPTRR